MSAHRSFRWVYRNAFKPWHIADFLILNPKLPRSLRSCYQETTTALEGLEQLYGRKPECHVHADETLDKLVNADMTRIFQQGLHEFLQEFIADNTRLAADIATTYHFNV